MKIEGLLIYISIWVLPQVCIPVLGNFIATSSYSTDHKTFFTIYYQESGRVALFILLHALFLLQVSNGRVPRKKTQLMPPFPTIIIATAVEGLVKISELEPR